MSAAKLSQEFLLFFFFRRCIRMQQSFSVSSYFITEIVHVSPISQSNQPGICRYCCSTRYFKIPIGSCTSQRDNITLETVKFAQKCLQISTLIPTLKLVWTHLGHLLWKHIFFYAWKHTIAGRQKYLVPNIRRKTNITAFLWNEYTIFLISINVIVCHKINH